MKNSIRWNLAEKSEFFAIFSSKSLIFLRKTTIFQLFHIKNRENHSNTWKKSPKHKKNGQKIRFFHLGYFFNRLKLLSKPTGVLSIIRKHAIEFGKSMMLCENCFARMFTRKTSNLDVPSSSVFSWFLINFADLFLVFWFFFCRENPERMQKNTTIRQKKTGKPSKNRKQTQTNYCFFSHSVIFSLENILAQVDGLYANIPRLRTDMQMLHRSVSTLSLFVGSRYRNDVTLKAILSGF